jgi:hypothetical protein
MTLIIRVKEVQGGYLLGASRKCAMSVSDCRAFSTSFTRQDMQDGRHGHPWITGLLCGAGLVVNAKRAQRM